jgi:hypothetical protein
VEYFRDINSLGIQSHESSRYQRPTHKASTPIGCTTIQVQYPAMRSRFASIYHSVVTCPRDSRNARHKNLLLWVKHRKFLLAIVKHIEVGTRRRRNQKGRKSRVMKNDVNIIIITAPTLEIPPLSQPQHDAKRKFSRVFFWFIE